MNLLQKSDSLEKRLQHESYVEFMSPEIRDSQPQLQFYNLYLIV